MERVMIFPKISVVAAAAFFLAGTPAPAFAENVPAARPVEFGDEMPLLSRQDYGEIRIGRSTDGNPLRVAGTRYLRGVGAHATSMLRLCVPADAAGFSGAVGIDDESGVPESDGAEFRILSGAGTLWSSGVMRRGDPAKKFSVALPPNTAKLYLLALAGGNDFGDHADWVNLEWLDAGTPTPRAGEIGERVFFGRDFGMLPESERDQGATLRRALAALRENGGGTLELERGTYHFYPENAPEMSLWISNHDQRETRRVPIPLVDLNGATIRGNGSTFVFHGECLPVLVMDSADVTIEDVRVDFAHTPVSEARVVGFRDGKTAVAIDRAAFPYEVRDGKLFFAGENFPPRSVEVALAFREKTGNIVAGTGDLPCGNAVEELPDGTLLLSRDFSRDGDGVAVGDVLALRDYRRPAPACVVYRAKDTTLRDIVIHSAFGMGLLAQRAENVAFAGTKSAGAKTSGVFPRDGSGRVCTTAADATHFSNVKGKILVENSFFEAMMDDAINVHSTCLDIQEILASDTLKCRYRHPQAIGFELFLAGENLRFIKGKTLENGEVVRVKNVRRVSPTEVLIQLDGNVPAGTLAGDAVENADFQPEVVFRGNVVRNNRARGALFTTPKKVLVEKNVFRDVAGSAILLAGDAQGWYESGACGNVEIRGNVFENNLTSRFQFTNAIISICPEVRDLAAQKNFYHRGVTIRGNEFRTFDVPLLFAASCEKIRFEDNRIFMNEKFRAWGQKPFQFRRCADVEIRGNAVAPVGSEKLSAQTWTLDDCSREMTPPREIRF